jgi:methyl-accepting chemotaxis protein
MSPRRRKILGYFAMFLTIDVLIASILGLIFMWLSFTAAGNALGNLFVAAEKATAVADKALLQVDNALIDFGSKSTALSNDVAQIGQNVADQGVIATLLPPDKATVFTDKVNEVKQTMAQVKDAIDAVRNFMQAFKAIPFIQTPNLDDSLLGKLDDAITKVEDLVGQIKQGIENLRGGIAGAIDQVASALAQLSDAVFQARFPVAQLRAYVQAANQVILPFLQVATPIFFLVVGAIFSILYVWTAFVMWKFFKLSNAWRKGASPTLAPVPVAAIVEGQSAGDAASGGTESALPPEEKK